ncbi:patatin-like phospholipase family protein [Spirochaeta africana]|uniref:Patatin n=1 Tax=Spirochaeta africana (strain ATCC 700263 / DSM 8902 / Z-7692) TaxID=889378 RepID=H9UFW3_SPIAZ|nr:patatin-like phospholipase family protein [Spirochaeta africana]AFG36406.1 patatin [Spirochaeta africana DSM 8902]
MLGRLFRRKTVTILSIDGGGIRGLLAARVLERLEQLLQERGDNRPFREHFDLIAGSSTGALIGLGLAMPPRAGITFLKGAPAQNQSGEFSISRICEMYNRMGSTIFPPDRFFSLRTVRQAFSQKYSAKPFERLLHAIFGDASLQDCRTNVLVTAYDTVRRTPHLFKQRLDRPGRDENFYLRDVARATAAAPTYFRPALIHPISADHTTTLIQEYCLIDGAVYANNPTMAAYIEARKIYPKARRFLIVSLGSGQLHGAYQYDDIRNWGYMDWVSPMRNVPIFTIMNDAQTLVTDYQLTKLPGVQFYRINDRLDKHISEDMDDSSPQNLLAIEEFARTILQRFDGVLREIADTLSRR